MKSWLIAAVICFGGCATLENLPQEQKDACAALGLMTQISAQIQREANGTLNEHVEACVKSNSKQFPRWGIAATTKLCEVVVAFAANYPNLDPVEVGRIAQSTCLNGAIDTEQERIDAAMAVFLGHGGSASRQTVETRDRGSGPREDGPRISDPNLSLPGSGQGRGSYIDHRTGDFYMPFGSGYINTTSGRTYAPFGSSGDMWLDQTSGKVYHCIGSGVARNCM